MSTMISPAPSAPATSQATPAELAAAEVARAERALERAREDHIAALERTQRVELATAAAIEAAEERLEAARLLARPEVLGLALLPKLVRHAVEDAAAARAKAATPEGAPRARRRLESARALARLAGVEVTT